MILLLFIRMKTSVCIVCLIVLVITVTVSKRFEGFGMSPGTLDQLKSTSAPTLDSRPYNTGYYLF